MKRLLEFQGYQPKVFPLQPPPRQIIPTPRRLSSSPNLLSEWKKIGSKNQKFVYINNSGYFTNRKIVQQSLSLSTIDSA